VSPPARDHVIDLITVYAAASGSPICGFME
jgi:hypothetical protein